MSENETKDLHQRVEEIMADLAKRGTRLQEKAYTSMVGQQDSGRGEGYREAARLIAEALAATETEQPEPEYEYAIQHKRRGGLATGLDKTLIDLLDEEQRANYTVLRRPKHTWEVVE